MRVTSSNMAYNLVLGIKEGDWAAFEVFYRIERNNLVHFVNSYVRDTPVAEDIAQETFMRLWEWREKIDVEGNLRALTFTIARNKTLDYLRAFRPAASLDECAALNDPSLDGLVEALDLKDLVKKTFMSLPPKIRRTFIKSRGEGLRNKEIAVVEGVTEKAVEYRIGSALRAFRKVLQ